MKDQDIGAAVAAYMRDSMAMPDSATDQEQNWMAGHMARFATHVLQLDALVASQSPAPQEDDDLHTGDDALLDALSSLRNGLDELLECEHGTMSAEQHEALGDLYESLNEADQLREAELKTAAPAPPRAQDWQPDEKTRK